MCSTTVNSLFQFLLFSMCESITLVYKLFFTLIMLNNLECLIKHMTNSKPKKVRNTITVTMRALKLDVSDLVAT